MGTGEKLGGYLFLFMMYPQEQTQLAWDLFKLYTLFTYTSIKFYLLSKKKKGAWQRPKNASPAATPGQLSLPQLVHW